jgi:Tfp pilus assembly protein PilN
VKRRPRIQPDPDQIVVLPLDGAAAMRFVRSNGGIELASEWDGTPEGTRPPSASIVTLPTGRTLCRMIALPDAADTQLETALRLQVDAQQLGSVPMWRTGAVVLPRPMAAEGRMGLSVEWPESNAAPAVRRDLPPDGDPCFAPDAGSLAALLAAGLDGPIVSIGEDRASITFALRGPTGAIVRSARIDPAEWPGCAEAAVLESALRTGADEPKLRALLVTVREALTDAGERGTGFTRADHARLERCTGLSKDSAWWNLHATAAGAALAWFGPLRPLVSLRPQPAGERPSIVGEWLNRLGDRALATRLLAAAVVAIAVAPPLIASARLLLLNWKVGDLAAREEANRAQRQRVALYQELQQRSWPMGKLLGDLACVTPEGVDWEDLTLSQDRNITIAGIARPHDGLTGTEVLLRMEKQMRDSRIFDRVQRKWEPQDGKGTVRFQMNATVTRAAQRPNYPIEQDFGRKTLAERRYGPEKPAEPETQDGAAPAPPDAASLPPEPSLGESELQPATAVAKAPEPVADGKFADAKSSTARKSGAGAAKSPSKTTEPSAKESAEATDGEAKGTEPKSRGIRGSRRPSGSGDGEGGLARRSERNPGSADAEFKPPPPLSDADIAAMSREEAQAALSKVSEARQRIATDSEEQKRLRNEFNKIMSHLRSMPK